ncbi:MAG: S9 family peptidase, partial [Vicinamibacteraceae bacterium]|nr:S9 family peptidase [Vicinamibacteraceae bacterium]
MMFTGALTLAGHAAADPPTPPVAKKAERVDTVHGERRVDPYYWLREKGSPDVVAYLEAENAYAAAVMKPTEALQETLYQEMLGRIKQTDLSVPFLNRGFYYYTRTEEGRQYPLYCRKAGSLDAPEQVMLDGNALAEGHTYFGLGGTAVSDDNHLLAYSTDFTGFRQYTLRVRDLRTGRDLADTREKVVSFAWAADNRTLFYTVEDEAKRSHRVYRMALSGPAADDALVHEETDERFSVYVRRSRSRQFLFLDSESLTTSEARVLEAAAPAAPPRLLLARAQDVEYDVDHRGDRLYMRINDRGRNFRLVSMPLDTSDPAAWTEVVPHREDVMLEGALLFEDWLVLYEREGAMPQVTVRAFATGESHRLAFPEPAYFARPDANPEFDSQVLRFVYTSPVTPQSVFDYDMRTRARTLLKQTEVLGGYDASRYEVRLEWAPAPDGVKVPVTLLARRGQPRDGTAAIYLTGYGAYGIPAVAAFSSNLFSLVDRGVVVARAHIRGGGDLGKRWHDEGRMMKKMNTFTDFIAVADYLVAQRVGARERMAITGGSAGGLLIGAVLNLRPDVARAAVLQVPFVDVINTMLDESLPLTVAEFEEWGNPKNKAEYDYIKRYCPYTNLAATAYPATLVLTSYNDSQVMYWEPAKYVAKMRTLRTDDRPLVFKTNMGAGHSGASGRYDRLREVAYEMAFV